MSLSFRTAENRSSTTAEGTRVAKPRVRLPRRLLALLAAATTLAWLLVGIPAPAMATSHTFTINDVTMAEGNSGGTTFAFTVTITPAAVGGETVDYKTTDGTGTTADSDYTGIGTTQLMFAAAETTKTVNVTVTGDTKFEPNETFTVDLSNPSGATISDASGLGTISNDDTVPTISIDDVSKAENVWATSNFSVTLSNPSSQTVTVKYATADIASEATAGEDYTAIATTTLTFNPGETSKTVPVTVSGDTKYEDDETFNVNLSLPTNSSILDGIGLGTITNDDAFPSISIDDVSQNEQDSGTSTWDFTVSLSNPSEDTITVDHETTDGTGETGAVSPTDFTAIATTQLSFATGETSKPVSVTVNGDTTHEGHETFTVDLSNVNANATIADASGLGTITNDDGEPTISITDVSQAENTAGTWDFDVTLSAASELTITVDYATADGPAGEAEAAEDYTAITTTTLTFNPGETSKTAAVTVSDDTKFENDEEFDVNLTSPTNATILDSKGTGQITNDDGLPSISIDDVGTAPIQNEGNSGTSTWDFTVSLSNPSENTITVDYATADGTATTADSDYTGIGATGLSFAAGETTKTVMVTVTGDTKFEPDETFTVGLSNVNVNATIADASGLGTISNDDAGPTISIDDVSAAEDTGTWTFAVTLSNPSAQTVTVDYATSDGAAGEAEAADDYTAITTTTLTFNPGETSKPVTVTVSGDTKYENDEDFNVDLTNASNATIADALGVGTITNDDNQPTISVNDVSKAENVWATSNFAVTLSNPSENVITVDYATSDGAAGEAEAADDYTAVTATTLTFVAGDVSEDAPVTVSGDTKYENDEDFNVDLTNATGGASIADALGVGTITNDDNQPTISVNDVSKAENVWATSNFAVTLSNPSENVITVDYATSDGAAGEAEAADDYTAVTATTLTFVAGDVSEDAPVTVSGDTKYENDEDFNVDLTNVTGGASILDALGVGTITNDDGLPSISIDDVGTAPIQNEGNSGTSTWDFTVSLSNPSENTITVDYATADGTATTADSDYTGIGATGLSFAAGETTKTVMVTVTGDTKFEPDETFTVGLSNVNVNATIADASGLGTISNDDAGPTISIDDVSAAEDTGTWTFAVTLSNPSAQTVTVDYATSDGAAGEAEAADDYTAITTTTLTFNPGETSKPVTVTVSGDTKYENDEDFNVDLTNASNATIADALGVGTITNDDNQPTISVNDVSKAENVWATSNFAVTLSNPSENVITVDYATSDGAAGEAEAADDYTAVTATTLTFVAGDVSEDAPVTVSGDTKYENDEDFNVDLTNATGGASIADALGVGTITNDDNQPTISVNDVSKAENVWATSNFAVTLSNPSENVITVDYATSDGAAGEAEAADDYTAVTATTLTFVAGDVSEDAPVTVSGDTKYENDEDFNVDLTNVTGGASILDALGVGTITNDDGLPSISIDDVSAAENTGPWTFAVTLSNPSEDTITVDYKTTDGTGELGAVSTGGAIDFTAIATTTLTFNPTDTSKGFSVTVNGDTTHEGDETFTVDLSNVNANATIADASGLGTITNDDGVPSISIDDVSAAENTGPWTFAVTLSAASELTITVDYATSDGAAGEAEAADDYTAIMTTTLTFNPTDTSKPVTVTVSGDTKYENDEDFNVDLTNASNATIADALGVGTITNDDGLPSITVDDVGLSEGNSGTTDFDFTVALSNPSEDTITVDYKTNDGGATTADLDYTGIPTTTLTFNPTEVSKTVTVDVTGDTKFEADDAFLVSLSNVNANATIADPSGTGTIQNDDALPAISIDDVSMAEGDAGPTTFNFTVSLSNTSSQTVTVKYATADVASEAVAGEDYTAVTTTTLTFNPGETSKTAAVTVSGDDKYEDDETFNVDLTLPTNASIADALGVGTITNDDGLPSISIDDVSAAENTGPWTFAVTLSNPSEDTITVDYKTTDGTGELGAVSTGGAIDFTAIATTTLTFNPTDTSKGFSVTVNGDTTHEGDETFTVDLSNVNANATIADASGLGTITNDDGVPSISIGDVTQAELNSGTSLFNFAVTLSAASELTITVDYATANIALEAVAGEDYTAVTATTLTFNPGDTSKTAAVSVLGDDKFEDDETFDVLLSNVSVSATINDGTGLGTITNEDTQPTISINDPSKLENAAGTLDFTVSLSNPSENVITVDYATSDGTATTADLDYTAVAPTTLTFAADDVSETASVTLTGDTKFELDDTLNVDLNNETGGATIADAQGVGTITNDDTQPTISIDDVPVTEGNAGTTNAVFTVTLSNKSYQTVTVDFTTNDGTVAPIATTADSDYQANTGSASIAENDLTDTITVLVNGDAVHEGDETYTVDLSNPGNATIADAQGAGTINNDETAPQISINDVTPNELDAGSAKTDFTVSLDVPSQLTITVNYATANVASEAVSGEDYTAASGTVTFVPLDVSETVSVFITGDTKYEDDETFDVDLSMATVASILDAKGVGTIVNDDALPVASIGSVMLAEGNGGTTAFTFTVTLSNPSEDPATVDYATGTIPGSATAGSDFTAASGTLTFAAEDVSETASVDVLGDTIFEANETFTVGLSTPSGLTIGGATGVGKILNDDPVPTISIDDVSQAENAGTTWDFTVSLSNASDQIITVAYDLNDGTATVADSDYTDDSGTVTFAALDTSETVSVTVANDAVFEDDETFTVDLSSPTNATIVDGSGLGTITNDDSLPTISIGDVTQVELDSSTSTFNFAVTLSVAAGATVTVDYATSNVVGEAVAGEDYTVGSGTVTFTAGDTSETVSITVTGDTKYEDDETFNVDLSSPTNATIADALGVGTITNDDGQPTISVNDVSDAEDTGTWDFAVTLSNPSEDAVTVDYATSDVAAEAVAGEDYTAVAATTLTFAPGDVSETASVSVTVDTKFEDDETFNVDLSSPTNATIADALGVGTITNDDGQPTISVNDVSDAEDTGTWDFAVTLSNPSENPITVDYATSDVAAEAVAGEDYTAVAATTLTFIPGDVSETASVSVTVDTKFEDDETFNVDLSSPTNATIADALGVGTITNDDGQPTISVNDVSDAEDTGTWDFAVTLSNPSENAVTVDYATSDVAAEAVAGEDYTATSGTTTFLAGAVSKTVSVSVTVDTKFEDDETFNVDLSSPTNATIADALGVGTITNDDGQPTISVNDVSDAEDTGTWDFAVTLSNPSENTVTVDYATSDVAAEAVAGEDYTAVAATTLTFAPGDVSETASVSVTVDTKFEDDETFNVDLSNETGGATIADALGVGTITNDDGQPTISVNDVSDAEDTGTWDFAVTLSNPSENAVTVDYATSDVAAEAVAGEDYTAVAATTLTFAPGDVSETASVSVTVDTKFEDDETFDVDLSNETGGATIADALGVGTITNDDGQPTISVNDVSDAEDTGTWDFAVTLSNPSENAVTVDYATSDDEALAGEDYTAGSGTVAFVAGDTSETVSITVTGDTKYEDDENFNVDLSSPTNATIADALGVGTITNDDAQPTISVNDVSDAEDTGTWDFAVTLSNPSENTITVDYATSDVAAEALAGEDYTAVAATTLTFTPGDVSETASVSVTVDTKFEDDEDFNVDLSNATGGAILGDALGVGTITNDDGQPTILVNDVSDAEDTGTWDFAVTLSNPSENPITVDYATSDVAAEAVAGEDYTAVAATTLTFAPGDTSETASVSVTVDTKYEDDETFNVDLSNATGGATIADALGVGTITNDDGQPSISIGDKTQAEGNAGAANFDFAVTLSNPSENAVTVVYSTGELGATAGEDYTFVYATLVFPPGDVSETASVTVSGDTKFEDDEDFNVFLSSPINATLGVPDTGVGTISNDDGQPTISVNDVSDAEDTGTWDFAVTLSNPSENTVTVDYATSDVAAEAVAGEDYTAVAATTLTFAPGDVSETASVSVTVDTKYEDDETFNVDLTTATGGAIFGDALGVGTITNDDALPSISISDVSDAEDTGTWDFAVTLSNPSENTVTVNFASADVAGEAAAGEDYTADSGTVTFAAGDTSETVSVSVTVDTKFEDDETFDVDLSLASNATIADALGVGTITNDDGQPTISIDDVSDAEDTGTWDFTVTLSNPSENTVTVDYATSDVAAEAVAGEDYTATSGTTTFLAGAVSKTVSVSVTVDTKFEDDETFNVDLSNATGGATIADALGVGTITNDDGQPTISVNDVSDAEDTGTWDFAVTLSNPSENAVTVDYATSDVAAEAVAGEDYTAVAATTLTFTPGDVSETASVSVTVDTKFEDDETFDVDLSNATGGATIGDALGVGTITNDDGQPTISVNDVSDAEDTGTWDFAVTLSNPSENAVTVDYATSDVAAEAVAGEDYTAVAATTLTFAPGDVSETASVSVTVDTKFEDDETFNVDLSSPTNATIADALGVGTITNDDGQPTISVNDVSDAEDTGTWDFTVTLSNPSENAVTVDYATSDVAAEAVAGEDYTAVAATTLTFTPGDVSETASVSVTVDTKFEDDETFDVDLSNATGGATIGDALGVGTITNDDGQPTISVNDVSDAEDTGTWDFAVTLSNPSENAVTVDYATSDVAAEAVAGEDYTAVAATTLTFTPGDVSETASVSVTVDTKFEDDETFNVDLSNATGGATIGDALGVGTITNDDGQPTISIGDVTQAEGNAGSANFDFAVTLSNPSEDAITVDYATADVLGEALAGEDYTAGSGTVTFAAGDTSETVSVSVTGDTKYEDDETFRVDLTAPSNATITDNQGVGTITNDDSQPLISINDVSENEDNSGTTAFNFTVSLSNSSENTITVDYATSDDEALAGEDYTAGSGTATFAAGDVAEALSVSVTGDTKYEDDETFNVDLSTATGGATIADALGVGTITNDDTQPTISVNDVSDAEDTGTWQFAVTLSNPSEDTVTVNYATSDVAAEAVAGEDYTAVAGTLVFLNGDISESVTVTVSGDTKFEDNEDFNVDLSVATSATIADALGVGTISNDDAQPTISIDDVSDAEDTGTWDFTVSLSNPSENTITVDYATSDVAAEAVAGEDYTAVAATTLTFTPGDVSETASVTVTADTKYEDDEDFNVDLSNETGGATIGDAQGLGTISNDDALPSISITDVSQIELDSGTSSFDFTVTLSNPSEDTVTVDYATADDDALAGEDYTATSGTMTFLTGDVSETLSVTVSGDTKVELDEDFDVDLSNPAGATIADAKGVGTILTDDPLDADISVTKTDGVITATPGGSITYTVIVTNNGPSDDPAVSLTDTFSAELTCTFTSVAAGGATGNTAAGAGDLAETLSMPVGSSVTYTVNCDIDSAATGTLTNTATVAGSFDLDAGNDSATDNDTVLAPEADLNITKTDSADPTFAGESLTYTITVNNAGPSDATDVVVTDTLDPNVTFVSTSGCAEDPAGVPTCTLGTVAAGGSAFYTITVTLPLAVTVSNTASVTTATTDPNAADNTATETTLVKTRPTCDGEFVTILGTNGADIITGTAGRDVIHALGGNDTINSLDGNDLICAGSGDDTVNAGIGNDLVYGGGGVDMIFGGDGLDTLIGGPGNDEIHGQGGNDRLYGDDGDDEIHGGDDNDRIFGDAGNDTLYGDGGIDFIYGGADNDEIHGGDDNDRLRGEAGDDDIFGDLGADVILGGIGIDTIDGGDGNDRIFGEDGDDVIYGDLGADLIKGGLGQDEIHGGDGADRLLGEDGNDDIFGDAGNDKLWGGDGDDDLDGGADFDFVDGGAGTDTCINGESVINCP